MNSRLVQVSLFLLFLLFLQLNPFSADLIADDNAEPPSQLIELRLVPDLGVPGQIRRLEVDVLTDQWFLNAPKFPDIKIDGAIVLPPKSFGMNFSERRQGKTYTGQRQEYLVFPQRKGAFLVKPIQVELTVPGEGSTNPVTTSLVSSQILFVTNPKSSVASDNQLVSTGVSLTETYLPGAEDGMTHLAVGDVLIREITLVAEDTLAMFIPPFDQSPNSAPNISSFESAIEGGRLYKSVSDISDRQNRGQLNARRSETWQYKFERAGEYTLPAISVRYWDLIDQQSREVSLSARKVRVGAALNSNAGDVLSLRWLMFVVGILILLLGIFFSGRYCAARIKTHWHGSELIDWYRLKRADQDLWLAQYHRWRAHHDAILSPEGYLREVLRHHYSDDTGDTDDIDSAALIESLACFRQQLKAENTNNNPMPQPALPRLNPKS